MSNYIRVADISAKKVYSLGKARSAASILPLLLSQLSLKSTQIVLYGDESHGFLEDKYEDEQNFEQIMFDSYTDDWIDWVKSNKWSLNEFNELFEEYGGSIITPLELIKEHNSI